MRPVAPSIRRLVAADAATAELAISDDDKMDQLGSLHALSIYALQMTAESTRKARAAGDELKWCVATALTFGAKILDANNSMETAGALRKRWEWHPAMPAAAFDADPCTLAANETRQSDECVHALWGYYEMQCTMPVYFVQM